MRRAAAIGKRSITAHICRVVTSMMCVVVGLLGTACASGPRPETAARVTDVALRRCESLPPPIDTTVETVYITLEAPLRKVPLPTEYADGVLKAVRDAFVFPSVPILRVFGALPVPPPHQVAEPTLRGTSAPHDSAGASASGGSKPKELMTPSAFGEVELTLDSVGRLSHVQLTQSSMSSTLDRAIVEAPHRADSLHRFPDATPDVTADRAPMFIVLHAAQPRSGLSEALFQAYVPEWGDGHNAAGVPGSMANPEYPQGALGDRLNDTVTFEFVIDATGRAVPATVRIVSAHYREFARAAMSNLMHARFRPASIDGCVVEELVTAPFVFIVVH